MLWHGLERVRWRSESSQCSNQSAMMRLQVAPPYLVCTMQYTYSQCCYQSMMGRAILPYIVACVLCSCHMPSSLSDVWPLSALVTELVVSNRRSPCLPSVPSVERRKCEMVFRKERKLRSVPASVRNYFGCSHSLHFYLRGHFSHRE